MIRVPWPVDLGATSIERTGGRPSLGSSESVTGKIQTVSQPYGRQRYQIEFPPMQGQRAADFAGFIEDLEDGANWTVLPYTNPLLPRPEQIGLQPWHGDLPFSNGAFFSNGRGWLPSLPPAEVAASAAIGDREVTIDITAWNGHLWRGLDLGFLHFGAYRVQRVEIDGTTAVARLGHGLRREIEAGEPCTLYPALAVRLMPREWSEGKIEQITRTGGKGLFVEVPDDVVRSSTID